ncbi:Hypothetical_protein [Hexamita inflata]|uniref:Hypothetical_protein n=1 Tax=Hexamita inflata TaxID=28002 RepID=A0AA86TVD8_9EUKA|nr:Hypothetical protein HINF_LOCUS10713 [Hexamita inflata]
MNPLVLFYVLQFAASLTISLIISYRRHQPSLYKLREQLKRDPDNEALKASFNKKYEIYRNQLSRKTPLNEFLFNMLFQKAVQTFVKNFVKKVIQNFNLKPFDFKPYSPDGINEKLFEKLMGVVVGMILGKVAGKIANNIFPMFEKPVGPKEIIQYYQGKKNEEETTQK